MLHAMPAVFLCACLQNTGTSLLECFDIQGIDSHVRNTYDHAQATKSANQMPINPGDECKVCGLTKLTFEPPCIYCTTCGQRIKRGQTYHCTPVEQGCEFRGFWCHGCLNEHKGDRIPWDGSQVMRAGCWVGVGCCCGLLWGCCGEVVSPNGACKHASSVDGQCFPDCRCCTR